MSGEWACKCGAMLVTARDLPHLRRMECGECGDLYRNPAAPAIHSRCTCGRRLFLDNGEHYPECPEANHLNIPPYGPFLRRMARKEQAIPSPAPPALAAIAGTEQPMPVGEGQPITELVVADLLERSRVGTLRYGTPLRAHNGRDPLRDAYEEALDLCHYLRQAIEERDEWAAQRHAT